MGGSLRIARIGPVADMRSEWWACEGLGTVSVHFPAWGKEEGGDGMTGGSLWWVMAVASSHTMVWQGQVEGGVEDGWRRR